MAQGVNTSADLDPIEASSVDGAESLADRAYREIRDRLVMLDIRLPRDP